MELDWYRFNYPKLERWIDNQNVTNPDVFGLNRHRIVESYLEFTDRRSAITTNTVRRKLQPAILFLPFSVRNILDYMLQEN